MLMAQKVRLGNEKDVDGLSSLPDELICHIISFLPIQETTRTSILSRRWRYLFAWTSSLTIDYNVAYFGFSFMYLVNKVLFSRSRATIDKLCLKFSQDIDPSQVDGWIHYALWHGVQELQLCIPIYFQFNELPSSRWLFNCKTLVRLELQFGDYVILKVPDTVCLPNLKVLHLGKIKFSGNGSVQRLFSECCMLEELLVQCCKWGRIRKFNVSNPKLKRLTLRSLICSTPYQELVINAPSLVYFEHVDLVAKYYSLLNLLSLVEALIDVGPITSTFFYHIAAADLLIGISSTQSLHIGSRFSRAFGLYQFPKFPNLTYLKINTSYSYNWEGILGSSPCLETLVIELELPLLADTLILPKRVPSCLLSHLKAIKFFSFHGEKDELQLVEYILMNAQVLQNLTVRIRSEKRQQSEIIEALVKLPKVSKHCHVMIV